MNIAFARESVAEVWDELQPILKRNNIETGSLASDLLNPDRARYEAIEQYGSLAVFTMRSDGKLIGYNAFFYDFHMHYAQVKYATQDVLYVEPAHRGEASVKFIEWCDEELKKLGLAAIIRGVTEKKDYSYTLKRFGYRKLETNFMRELT